MDKAYDVAKRWLGKEKPAATLVLGSGWAETVKALNVEKTLPFSSIPGLGTTSVHGHTGLLHLASNAKRKILVFQGRRHWYEGDGWTPVMIPIYITIKNGSRVIFLTNAAGSLRPQFKPGSIMLIDDHINLMGSNPLLGPHIPGFGNRFPSQFEVYDKQLIKTFLSIAIKEKISVRKGIYAAMSGPVYETPAEARFLKAIGADAVGMSTVPEAMAAYAAGLRVVALSCISNSADPAHGKHSGHKDVLATVTAAQKKLARLISRFFDTFICN